MIEDTLLDFGPLSAGSKSLLSSNCCDYYNEVGEESSWWIFSWIVSATDNF